MLRKPDDWKCLQRRAQFVAVFRPRRARAMIRLARRWRRLDAIEWLAT